MQITKVKNYRSAVVPKNVGQESEAGKTSKKAESQKGTGILYQVPGENYNKNIDELVENRIEDAKKLYSPLPTRQGEKDEAFCVLKKFFENFKGSWGNLNKYDIGNAAKNTKPEIEKNERNQKKRENERKESENLQQKQPKIYVDEDIRKFFKKSLARNNEFIGLSVKLCNYLLSGGEELLNNEKIYFANTLNNDYNRGGKGNGKDGIVKSIVHQNLPIQPVKNSAGNGILPLTSSKNLPDQAGNLLKQDDWVLAVSGMMGETGESETKKENSHLKYKKADCQALNRFLSEYAILDNGMRKEMLRKLRRLFVLFAYGEDEARQLELTDDYDWDKNHSEGKQKTEYLKFKEIIVKNEEKPAIHFDEFKDEQNEKTDDNVARQKLRTINIRFYHRAMNELAKLGDEDISERYFDDRKMNEFWIRHFESAFEKRYAHFSGRKKYMLEEGYLEKIWKDTIAYCAMKYVAIGKVVWNFTMGDLSKVNSDKNLGMIPNNVKGGVSSFDFEMIKARESFQRKVAVYVSFASNNYARATTHMEDVDGNDSDFLLFGSDKLSKHARANALHQTLQFFGGESAWSDEEKKKIMDALEQELGGNANEPSQNENGKVKESLSSDVILIDNFRKALYSVRNETFHFTTMNEGKKWNSNLMCCFFKRDTREVSRVIKKQFYSNNLPMFYQNETLKTLMEDLYAQKNSRMIQVPAFRTVFVRKNFPDFLENRLKMKPGKTWSPDDVEKWRSGLYFLLKEIYYNDFLTFAKAREYFDNAVEAFDQNALEDLEKAKKKSKQSNKKSKEEKEENKQSDKKSKEEKEAEKSKKALDDFKKAIANMKKGASLAKVCQYIMTEQNRRNQSGQIVRTSKQVAKLKFKHYSILLELALREAFALFLEENSEKFGFIKEPALKENMPDESEFLSGWSCTAYEKTVQDFAENETMQKWYILGRLLPSKQINLLNGVVKNYVQFITDVERRATVARAELLIEKNVSENTTKYQNVVAVLDICSKLGGDFSNEISDYFEEGEYEKFLGAYIETDKITRDEITRKKFFDAINPILNRNVVMAKLYGCQNVMENVVSKVTVEDIRTLVQRKGSIELYIKTGSCKNIDEQKNVIAYQRLNNKVELRTILDYAEIINELLGQLVSWSFMRERDLLYYQLGFHYMCLNNDAAKKPVGYTELIDNAGHTIKGVILSQIAALYVSGVRMYAGLDENGKETDMDTEDSFKRICNYSKSLYPEEGKYFLYVAGLELFENVNEHDQVVKTRNYIDHFRYYTTKNEGADGKQNTRSLLDLYSEVFDRFFEYSNSFRKSVPVIFRNILLRHFMIANICFESGNKKMDDKSEKSMALMRIRNQGIGSDLFTYKYKQENGGTSKKTLPALSMDYMEHVAKILYYPEAVPEDLVDKERYEKDGGELSALEILPTANESSRNGQNKKTNQGQSKGKKQNTSQGQSNGKKQKSNQGQSNGTKKKNDSGNSFGTAMGDLLKNFKFD